MNELYLQASKVLNPLSTYLHQCHVASIALVKAGIGDRVARGFCPGVGSQHSWVVKGDPYKPEFIIDPTLWSYRDDVADIFIGCEDVYGHTPHGKGSIWEWGRPTSGGGEPIELMPKTPLSSQAAFFISQLGPLDRQGWMTLASSAPVEDWPSGEIIAAMDDTDALRVFIPIDRLGMLTDRNPGGLYLA